MDRSSPRSPARAASTSEDSLETWDKASHSMRNRGTDRVEYPCFPVFQAKLCPTCRTQEARFPDLLRLVCTASEFLPDSKCFAGLLLDSLSSARTNRS